MDFKSIFILIFCALNLVDIHSLSIDGPALTRYDPCGLGVFYFQRLSRKNWRCVLELGLYKHLFTVKIGVHFEKRIRITGVSQDSNFTSSDHHRSIFLTPLGKMPQRYHFDLTVKGLSKNESDVPTVTEFLLNDVPFCNHAIKSSHTVDSLNLTDDIKSVHEHVCGRRSLDITELTSTMTEAKAGDWPWHASIFIRDPKTKQFLYSCGANIVSSSAVLTAAHCVHKEGEQNTLHQILVWAGVSNHTDIDRVRRQILDATAIIVHPSYINGKSTADLAIVKVNRFKFTAYVQPICVRGPDYDKESLVGIKATTLGFGLDNDGKLSQVLRSAYIVVQNDTTCLDFNREVYTDLLDEFTFCAGNGPVSGTIPRNGDSGGGLVVPELQSDHRVSWFLRGVMSRCGIEPAPGQVPHCHTSYYVVYTNVAPHFSWIYHHSGLQFRNNDT